VETRKAWKNSLQRHKAQLVALQAPITDDHPDIMLIKYQIEELKTKPSTGIALNPRPDTLDSSLAEPPRIQQLRNSSRSI